MISADEYPEVNDIVQKDVYVDVCLSGEENINKPLERADHLELLLYISVTNIPLK